MESEESQKQASHAFHGSLEISHKTRDSHISTAPMTRFYLSEQAKPGEEMGGGGKVEIQNQDFHFPTAPISLRRKEEITSKNDKSKSHLHKTLDTAASPASSSNDLATEELTKCGAENQRPAL
jgi:hypothetical protein